MVQQTEDASAIGAAMLVLKETGMIESYESIQWEEGQVYIPNTHHADTYETLFPVFKNLYPILKDSMHSITPL